MNQFQRQIDNWIEREEPIEECCLCGKYIEGYGNNAMPLVDGRCCDECNLLVIKERIKQMENKK